MTVCVIDIGSNTIRAVVYELAEGRYIKKQSNAVKSMLFEHTRLGILTEEGKSALSAAIDGLKKSAAAFEPEYYAFATSAFRDLNNRADAVDYIFKKNKIRIDLLDENDEAVCDYLGLRSTVGSISGAGADLGGGSCQLMYFSELELLQSCSLPIGCARLKRRFCAACIPAADELERIYRYVKEQLTGFEIPASEALHIMGGTARGILALKHTMTADAVSRAVDMKELAEFAAFSLDKECEAVLKGIVGKRYDTVGVGIVVYATIAEHIGAKKLIIEDCSVRDGYIQKYLFKKS